MNNFDMVVKSKNIFVNDRLIDCEIGIKNGKIVAISKTRLENTGIVIDAKEKIVLPGGIDTHVHIRDPGHSERETFKTGTMAAAAGGTTTIFEHPVSIPPPHIPEIPELAFPCPLPSDIDAEISCFMLFFLKTQNISHISFRYNTVDWVVCIQRCILFRITQQIYSKLH
jgi:hypothetical protein